MWKATSGGTAMPEPPSLDPRRTGDPVATTDEPLAVPDCAGGLRTPAGASNRAARYLLGSGLPPDTQWRCTLFARHAELLRPTVHAPARSFDPFSYVSLPLVVRNCSRELPDRLSARRDLSRKGRRCLPVHGRQRRPGLVHVAVGGPLRRQRGGGRQDVGLPCEFAGGGGRHRQVLREAEVGRAVPGAPRR